MPLRSRPITRSRCVLVHPAVERLGVVAPTVERLGELVDLVAGAAEDQGRGRRLEVEDPAEGGGFVGPGHDVGDVAHQGRIARGRRLAADLDPDRVAQVAPDHPVDPGRHRGREEDRLAAGGRLGQDRFDVLGEAHVEHLVGLVEDDHLAAPPRRRVPRAMWSRARPGVATTTSTPRFEGPELAGDRLPAVDGDDAGAEVPPVAVHRLGDLHRPAPGWAPAPAPPAPSRDPWASRSSTGRAKAAVLPVPVAAWPTRSRPSSSGGIVSRWIGVGSS